jgi:hypothetical protein
MTRVAAAEIEKLRENFVVVAEAASKETPSAPAGSVAPTAAGAAAEPQLFNASY